MSIKMTKEEIAIKRKEIVYKLAYVIEKENSLLELSHKESAALSFEIISSLAFIFIMEIGLNSEIKINNDPEDNVKCVAGSFIKHLVDTIDINLESLKIKSETH